jgi:hypothetical protein
VDDGLADVGGLDGQEVREVAVHEAAAGQQQWRLGRVVLRELAEGEEVAGAAADRRPVAIVARQQADVRHQDLLHEGPRLGDERPHGRDPGIAQRRRRVALDLRRVLAAERSGGTAPDRGRDHPAEAVALEVRALPAEHREQLGEAALPVERIEVVRGEEEVGLRRERVGGVSPVAVREDAELSG